MHPRVIGPTELVLIGTVKSTLQKRKTSWGDQSNVKASRRVAVLLADQAPAKSSNMREWPRPKSGSFYILCRNDDPDCRPPIPRVARSSPRLTGCDGHDGF